MIFCEGSTGLLNIKGGPNMAPVSRWADGLQLIVSALALGAYTWRVGGLSNWLF